MRKASRIHTLLPAAVALITILPRTTFACAVCTGGADSTIAPALNAAIFLMLGFIGAMLASVGGFMFYLHRRSQQPAPLQ